MRKILLVVIALMLVVGTVQAQSPLEQVLLSSNDQAYMKAYLKPLGTGFGIALGNGIYHSAKVHPLLGFDFGFSASFVVAPTDAKEFTPTTLPPNWVSPAPTVAGKDLNSQYLQPSGTGFAGGALIIQGAVGLPMGFEVIFRFSPELDQGGNKFSMSGFGLRYQVSNLLPIPFLPDIAAHFMTTSMKYKYSAASGDNGSVEAGTTSIGLEASKSLNLILLKFTLYGGIATESSKFDFKYTSASVPGSLSLDPENGFKALVGINIRLLFLLNVYADYSFAKYSAANVGVAFGIR